MAVRFTIHVGRRVLASRSNLIAFIMGLLCFWTQAAPAGQNCLAIVSPSQSNPYFALVTRGFLDATKELGRCAISASSEYDPAHEAALVEDMVARSVSGIAIDPLGAALWPVLRQAKEAGIRIVTWGSDLPLDPAQSRDGYIGPDNRSLGSALADLVRKSGIQPGKVCIQADDFQSPALQSQVDGIRSGLAGTSSISGPLVGQNGWTEVEECRSPSNWDVSQELAQLSVALDRNRDLAAFISTSSRTLEVGGDKVNEQLRNFRDRIGEKRPAVFWVNNMPSAYNPANEGLITASVGVSPYDLGHNAAVALHALIEGSPANFVTPNFECSVRCPLNPNTGKCECK